MRLGKAIWRVLTGDTLATRSSGHTLSGADADTGTPLYRDHQRALWWQVNGHPTSALKLAAFKLPTKSRQSEELSFFFPN